MTDKPLFGWLQSLYPLWRALDEEAELWLKVRRYASGNWESG